MENTWFLLLASQPISPIIDLSLKSLVLLLAAGALSLAFRRASAASRHLLWLAAIFALLCLPVLSLALPDWQLPILPATLSVAPGSRAKEAPPVGTLPSGSATKRSFDRATFSPMARPAASPSPEAFADTPAPVERAGSAGREQKWVVVVWLLGAMLLLARLTVGLVIAKRIVLRCRPAASGPLAAAAAEARAALGVRRPVSVRVGVSEDAPAVAVTIGFLRPAVLLPKQAQMWPPERLRAVLLHEMAHVGRADWAAQMLAQVAGALYWPNLLVWLALRRLRAESEQACDDLVLGAGVRASDYAGHLLEIVRGLCDRRGSTGAALTVVRRQEIQERLGAILAGARSGS